MFHLTPEISTEEFIGGLSEVGVKVGLRDGRPFRAVTNSMISSSDIDEALVRIETVIRGLGQTRSEPAPKPCS
jgi:hypothetical protein